jgi:hypothetical protein
MNHEHILIICVNLVWNTSWNEASVTSSPLALPCSNACQKIPPEINFIYLGNNEIYCILKMCCIMYFIFHKMPCIS